MNIWKRFFRRSTEKHPSSNATENERRHGRTLRHKWQSLPSPPSRVKAWGSDGKIHAIPLARIVEEIRSLVSALPVLSSDDLVAVGEGMGCSAEPITATYAEAVDEIVWVLANHQAITDVDGHGAPAIYSAERLLEKDAKVAFVEVILHSDTSNSPSEIIRACRQAPDLYALFATIRWP